MVSLKQRAWVRLCVVAVAFGCIAGTGIAQRQSRASNNQTNTDTKKNTSGFRVEAFSPSGPVTPGAVISVTFSDDVVTSEALDAGDTPKEIFSFKPTIEGALQWESLRQVRFAPTKPLKQGTEYVVRINPLLQNAHGEKLKDASEYRFQTPPLSLKSAEQVSFYDNRRVSIRLAFSDTINPQDLRKYLSLHTGDGVVQWKLQSDVRSASPVIITDPLSTDVLNLKLEPGLRGVAGPLGLRNRVEQKVKLNFRLVATKMKGVWKNGKPELNISFSSNPDSSSAENFITIDPPVKASFSQSYGTLRISGPFEADKRYTVHLKKGLKGTQEKILLEPTTLTAWMPSITPFLELPEAGGYLGTQGRMKLRVQSAAITTLTVTARRVFDSNLPRQPWYDYDWRGTLGLGKVIAKKSYDLKPEPNKSLSNEIDLRELLGPNASGVYGIEVVGEASPVIIDGESQYRFSSYRYEEEQSRFAERTVINLSNLGLVAKKAPGQIMVFVAGLDSAQPLPGITVTLYSNRYQQLGEGITNASGMVTIKGLPEKDEDAQVMTVVAHNADKSEIALMDLREDMSGWEEFESSGRRYLHNGYEAFVTPERGAYRPGETIHVTGFIRGQNASTPPAAFPVEVVLVRPDGKKMTPEIHMPSDTGLLSFNLTVPDYAPTGYYGVEVRMPGSANAEDDNDYDY